jgi:cbb3-type cytochrome oxidase subunit 3
MDELRSAFTVISLLTFIGIVWWAWRPGSKDLAQTAVSDVLMDDDHVPRSQTYASNPDRGVQK